MRIIHEKFNPSNIEYGFFTKEVYLPKGSSKEESKKIARDFCNTEDLAIVQQKHTNEVVLVKKHEDSNRVADAQITNEPTLALAVLTADCVPILLADDDNKIVGTVHAGWRGARAGIIKNAIEEMYKIGAKKITAIIGPCIKQKSYEVDTSFYDNFTSESLSNKKFFIPSERIDHYMFDLPGYVKNKLSSLNVSNIFDIERNTYEEEDNFFSHRRSTHKNEIRKGDLISYIKIL